MGGTIEEGERGEHGAVVVEGWGNVVVSVRGEGSSFLRVPIPNQAIPSCLEFSFPLPGSNF